MSMSPNDADYPALLATEKANAVARVEAASDINAQIHGLLMPVQQAQIPSIITTDRDAHDTRIARWRSQHAS